MFSPGGQIACHGTHHTSVSYLDPLASHRKCVLSGMNAFRIHPGGFSTGKHMRWPLVLTTIAASRPEPYSSSPSSTTYSKYPSPSDCIAPGLCGLPGQPDLHPLSLCPFQAKTNVFVHLQSKLGRGIPRNLPLAIWMLNLFFSCLFFCDSFHLMIRIPALPKWWLLSLPSDLLARIPRNYLAETIA